MSQILFWNTAGAYHSVNFDIHFLFSLSLYLETKMLNSLRVNPISLSYPFPFPYPFVLPLALVPRNQVVSARGENIPLWNETTLGYCYVIIHRHYLAATSTEATSVDHKLAICKCVYVDCVGLVMFSLVRKIWDCCANQQCNVSVEK